MQKPNPATARSFYTVKQVAERYGVGPATVWRWSRKGPFPKPVKLGDNCTRWRLADLEKWESEREAA